MLAVDDADSVQDGLEALDSVEPDFRRTARALACQQLEKDGMLRIDGPFEVAALPGAVRAFGWRGEGAYGARLAAAQVTLCSGWVGSVATLGTALLVVIPLLKLPRLAAFFRALLVPLALLPRGACSLVDELMLFAVAVAVSGLALVQSVLTGSIAAGPAAFLSAGPKLLLRISAICNADKLLALCVGALATCVWAPLKEELLFRAGLQRWLERALRPLPPPLLSRLALGRGGATPPPEKVASSSGSDAAAAEARAEQDARRAARAVSSFAFALAHVGADSNPLRWATCLPTAVAAGASSYFCFGLLFEARGLPAAIGAHVAHNTIVSSLLVLRILDGQRLTSALVMPRLGPLVPAALYATAIVRRRRRRNRSLAGDADEGRGQGARPVSD